MKQIECTDSTGRKFSLMVKDDVVVDDAWIAEQNANRAKFGTGGRTEPIVEWRIMAL
jgi:hypothetical protein